jgi:hypothetical protein
LDCVVESEVYVDTGAKIVAVIDTNGSVWFHYFDWFAIGRSTFGLFTVSFFAIIGLLLSLLGLGIRAVIRKLQARKTKTVGG